MLAEAATPNTADWWLLRLGTKLAGEHERLNRLHDYWKGHHHLPFGNKRMREAYRRHQHSSRTNIVKLVVESVAERLNISGFRVGTADDADATAWGWWVANNMAANSSLVHRAALTMSRAYVIVGQDPQASDDGEGGTPSVLVTGEDPRQVIHESSPTNRRQVLAALKVYRDDMRGCHVALVYLPDSVHYYRTTGQAAKNDHLTGESWVAGSWEPDDTIAPGGAASNTLGVVPVVPFHNLPQLDGHCLGEFEDVMPIQDRINTQVLDRLVISAMQAYRQRWGSGVSSRDEDGNPTNDFDPGADLLWLIEDENVKFGEFSPADLTGPLKAVEADVQHLAAITRTPPSYLLGSIVNASGDALAAAENGLVSKIKERAAEFGQSWVTVHRLATQLAGNTPETDVEVLWEDAQFRTSVEAASTAVQMMTAGVPWRTRMRMIGFSPGEIDRMQTERAMDALLDPNPDITIPGAPSANGSPGGARALPPGGPGGAAQPAADVARAGSPDRTGQAP